MVTATRAAGNRIRGLMAERNVSQHDMAAALNMSQAAVSRRLRGATPLDVNEITTIARVLGVPVRDLLPATEVAA